MASLSVPCTELQRAESSHALSRRLQASTGFPQTHCGWALQADQTFIARLMCSSFLVHVSVCSLCYYVSNLSTLGPGVTSPLRGSLRSWVGYLRHRQLDTRLELHSIGVFIFLYLICLGFHLCFKLCFWVTQVVLVLLTKLVKLFCGVRGLQMV